jgi:hypothetical protein
MENVILLNRYRHKQKKAWLAKHGPRLDRFIDLFIHANFNVDFQLVSDAYQHERQSGQLSRTGDEVQYEWSCVTGNDLAWDYHDLREVLETAITEAFGEVLWQELAKQYWYDSRCFSRDEVLDRLLTRFILGEPAKRQGEK